jgi:CHAD domain-containing protein
VARSPAAGPVRALRPRLAPDVTAEEAFVAVFAASLSQVARNAPGAARGGDAEYLHQLRVGLRRLRASLRAFRALVPRACTEQIVAPLRPLAPALGAARDWDVFYPRLLEMARAAGGADGTREVLLRNAAAHRNAAQLRLRRAIGGKRFALWLQAAWRWLAQAPWRKERAVPAAARNRRLATHAKAVLKRMRRRLRRDGARLDWDDAPARHAFRIRLKRFRYACELFRAAFENRPAARFIKRLRRLQDLLGDLYDIAVAQRLLAELCAARPSQRRSALPARLRDHLALEAASLQQELAPAWREVRKAPRFW